MKPSIWQKLLERLDKATRNGTVEWQAAGTEGAYVLAQSSGSVIVNTKPSPYTDAPGTIEVLDSDGRQVDQLEYRRTPDDDWGGPDPLAGAYTAAAKLADAIVSRSDVAEKVANSIIADLMRSEGAEGHRRSRRDAGGSAAAEKP